jgi:carbonic anhydrase
VIEQVRNLCHTTFVQNAWFCGKSLSVHGLINGVGDGLLRDLAVRITNADQIDDIYRTRAKSVAG